MKTSCATEIQRLVLGLLYGNMPFNRSTLSINYMSHNASHCVTLKRLGPGLLLSDVVKYEGITLSDNNPTKRQSCNYIIHYFVYIIYV